MTKPKTRDCGECANWFIANESENAVVGYCHKWHRPRFYMPRHERD